MDYTNLKFALACHELRHLQYPSMVDALCTEALAAIEELEEQASPVAMLDAYDDFMGGGVNSELARKVANAAVFAAAAYEKHGGGDTGTHAMARSFLLAAMDPTHHELDYLRADPASGEAARIAAKKLRAITETPNDRA
jgi:hypothetical protein